MISNGINMRFLNILQFALGRNLQNFVMKIRRLLILLNGTQNIDSFHSLKGELFQHYFAYGFKTIYQ